MNILYIGNGKGKTSAATGHIWRALGAGLSVAFCQFIKQDGVSGEQKVLKALLGDERVYIGGLGFVRGDKNMNKHIRAAVKTLEWAENIKADMVIMDEVIDAINMKLIHEVALEPIVDKCFENPKKHLIMTGHNDHKIQVLWNRSDYITEFNPVRHPFAKGRDAIEGIEF